jgi:hypothetical protein
MVGGSYSLRQHHLRVQAKLRSLPARYLSWRAQSVCARKNANFRSWSINEQDGKLTSKSDGSTFTGPGRKVRIPVRDTLRSVIDQIPRCSPIMLTDASGQPWDGISFRRQWRAAVREADITGLKFHDL